MRTKELTRIHDMILSEKFEQRDKEWALEVIKLEISRLRKNQLANNKYIRERHKDDRQKESSGSIEA